MAELAVQSYRDECALLAIQPRTLLEDFPGIGNSREMGVRQTQTVVRDRANRTKPEATSYPVPNNKIVLDLEPDITKTERKGGEDKCLSHFITHHERWVDRSATAPGKVKDGNHLKAI